MTTALETIVSTAVAHGWTVKTATATWLEIVSDTHVIDVTGTASGNVLLAAAYATDIRRQPCGFDDVTDIGLVTRRDSGKRQTVIGWLTSYAPVAPVAAAAPAVTATRTADSTHVVIYGGSATSGQLFESYAPTLAAAIAEHDALMGEYYVPGKSWEFTARIESLAYIDGLEAGTADYVARACRRCGAEHTDEYSVGDDYQGWYCSRCADYMVAAVWYGKPVHSADATVTRTDSARYPYRITCNAHRTSVRARTDKTAGNVAADTVQWCEPCADAVQDCECHGGAPCADCADAIATADSVPGIRELPADGDMFDALRRTLNRGVMVAWINADLINRAGCDVRKSIVLWDNERNFVMALAPAITPALFRERLPLVTDSMHRAGIRYWSVGI